MDAKADTNREFFEAVLLLGKMLGLSRSVAVVFALLYSHDDALSIENIVDASGLSKSAVSLALRDLMQLGAIQEKMLVGERCRRYCGQPDLGQVAADMVVTRLKFPLSQLRDKLDGSSGTPARSGQVRALLNALETTLASIQSEFT